MRDRSVGGGRRQQKVTCEAATSLRSQSAEQTVSYECLPAPIHCRENAAAVRRKIITTRARCLRRQNQATIADKSADEAGAAD